MVPMPLTADDVITRVRELLIDNGTSPRWTDAELLRHLSDGQRAISRADPTAIQKVAVMQLAEGTRQSLPADGESLLTITRNMGTTGTVPGRAVRIIRRDIIDDQNPMWHTEAKVTTIYNYIYDPTDSDAFFVYPPSNGLGHVEINYCYVPAELDELTDELDVDDIYITPLTDYVMFRALQKDSDFAAGMQRAQMHFQAFVAFLGVDGEDDVNPNLQTTPFDPAKKGTAR
jgi:hypothetical protein